VKHIAPTLTEVITALDDAQLAIVSGKPKELCDVKRELTGAMAALWIAEHEQGLKLWDQIRQGLQ